jgi:hypothetical protein
VRVGDFVPFENLEFQRGNVSKLRMYTPQEVFGLGQTGPIEDAVAKVKAIIQQNALYLVAIGGVVGLIGSVPLEGTSLEMTITVAGGVILAAGLLPLILGAIA